MRRNYGIKYLFFSILVPKDVDKWLILMILANYVIRLWGKAIQAALSTININCYEHDADLRVHYNNELWRRYYSWYSFLMMESFFLFTTEANFSFYLTKWRGASRRQLQSWQTHRYCLEYEAWSRWRYL